MGKLARGCVVCVLLLLSALPGVRMVGAAPIAWVEPPSGPPGTTFRIFASGLPAATRYSCRVIGPAGREVGFGPCSAETNGRGGLVQLYGTEEGYSEGGTYTVNFYDQANTFVVGTTFEVMLPDRRCFAETNQCMEGRFLRHWYANGGLAFNGFPLTGEFVERLEDGREYRVQYFERVRMEYHPENAAPNDVLLGQFGRAIHGTDPPVPQKQDAIYFPQTGHNVEGPFRSFLVGVTSETGLGVAYFGYPISEAFAERLEDGNIYTVQYFERARLELHPEIGAGRILLGQFGRRILESRFPGGAPSGALPSPSASPVPSPSAPPSATPMPSPSPSVDPRAGCDPSYPTLCLPPGPPDVINCADIPQRNFPVLPPDPHRLDGNNDGIGCES